MTITTKIIISVLLAGAVIGGVYFLRSDKVSENQIQDQEQIQNEQSQDSQVSGKKMAFADFVKQGGSYECTVNQYVAGTETSGKTYISGGMIRGEFQTSVQGLNITTNMIVRDGFTYTWSSMAPTMGYKAPIAEGAEGDTSTGMSGTYSFNAEQIGDYDCSPWTADLSKFTLPAGVNFQEI